LTILGTFLTRSGVVNSVHSFPQSAIGPLLLGYLVALLVLSVGLLLWRSSRREDAGALGAPLSREAVFLFQNVVFMAATLTVLLGTLYPLFAEAISGAQLSIGGPYFDRVEVPLALALLFLMGVGPQLPWHGASRATLERQFTAPALAAAAGALVALASGTTGVAPVLTYAPARFVTAPIVQEFAQAVRSPGIAAGARDDLYTILAAYDARGHAWATLRVRVIPLVSWLWAGGGVIGIGALFAALPPPRRRTVELAVAHAAAPAK